VTAEAAATLSAWLDPEQRDAAARLLTTRRGYLANGIPDAVERFPAITTARSQAT
jgi:hypothetical protein